MIIYGKNVRKGYRPTDNIGQRVEKQLLSLDNGNSNLPNIMDFLNKDCFYGKDYGKLLYANPIQFEMVKKSNETFEYAKEVCWALYSVEMMFTGVSRNHVNYLLVDKGIEEEIKGIIVKCISKITENLKVAKNAFESGKYIPGEYYSALQRLGDSIDTKNVADVVFPKCNYTTYFRRQIERAVLSKLNISKEYIDLLIGSKKEKDVTLNGKIRVAENYCSRFGLTELQDVKNYWVFRYTPESLGLNISYCEDFNIALRLMFFYIKNGLSVDPVLPRYEPEGFKVFTGTTKKGRKYKKYRFSSPIFKENFNIILAYYIIVYIKTNKPEYGEITKYVSDYIKGYSKDNETVRAIKLANDEYM